MKKTISVFLAALTLAAVALFGAGTASAEENYCDEFRSLEWLLHLDRGGLGNDAQPGTSANFNVLNLAVWASESYPGSDGVEGYWDGAKFSEDRADFPEEAIVNEDIAYPADSFDEHLLKTYDFQEDPRMLIEKENKGKSKDELCWANAVYDAQTNRYYISCSAGAYGGGNYYALVGYQDRTEGAYSVYFQLGFSALSREELEEWIEEGLLEDSNVDRVDIDPDPDGGHKIWYRDYIKMNVTFVDETIKLQKAEKVSDIPAQGEMITPLPKIYYDLAEGVVIGGDAAFREGTVVTAEYQTEGELFERAQMTLKDVATGAIQVIEITAENGGVAVQPDEPIWVEISFGDSLSAENLRLFYIDWEQGPAGAGLIKEIEITVDREARTAKAKLEHFSTYVLCNVAAESSTEGPGADVTPEPDDTPEVPQMGDESHAPIMLALTVLAGGALVILALLKRRNNRAEK